MKRIKLVLSLFIGVLAFNMQAQVNPETAPVMTFEKTVHDWGTINEGDKVETDFVFTNTGKSALIITKIKGSCGCTIPTGWSKEPIAPGATSKFHVVFNSRGKPNRQQKTVTITCNTAKGREYVKIKAIVTPDPAQEKIRAERAAKRREQQAKRKEEQAKLRAEKQKLSPNKAKETKRNSELKLEKERTSLIR